MEVLSRMKIEPEEFTSIFDPQALRKETYLLFEVKWGRSPRSYRGCCKNTVGEHAEINFLKNVFDRQDHKASTKCSITWYLSWSPCGACAQAVTDFLAENPTVTLEICAARLYHHEDEHNKSGLRNLHKNGVCIGVMAEQDYRYCWRTFVDGQRRQFTLWPKTYLMTFYFLRELYTILHVNLQEEPSLNHVTTVSHQELEEKFWRS